MPRGSLIAGQSGARMCRLIHCTRRRSMPEFIYAAMLNMTSQDVIVAAKGLMVEYFFENPQHFQSIDPSRAEPYMRMPTGPTCIQ